LYERHGKGAAISMRDRFITNLDDVVLEFSMKKIAAYDSSWVDVDIKINSAVISYDLKNWEPDGEILDKADIKNVLHIMNRWLAGEVACVEEYESVEPDLLLRFYPGEEKRIDFCICLQTQDLAFTENYIVLPMYNQKAMDFVEYWKKVGTNL
jgi:hypothetical protein